METIGDRIRYLRKDVLRKTQKDFGEAIGLKPNSVSDIESGKNNLTEQTANAICREFNIREKWLREGIGEMKIEDFQEERYASNVAKLQRTDDETIIRWANAIAETSPEVLKQVEEFMKKILGLDEE